MRVPIKRGGKCACGARVRFDIAKARTDHFMECPVVERRVAKAQRALEADDIAVTEESLLAALQRMNSSLGVDAKAVTVARELTGGRFG